MIRKLLDLLRKGPDGLTDRQRRKAAERHASGVVAPLSESEGVDFERWRDTVSTLENCYDLTDDSTSPYAGRDETIHRTKERRNDES